MNQNAGREPRIGIAMSGGGVRAAAFHTGVLARLARAGWLERICYISSVSGGSLVAGLVYSNSNWRWPRSVDFLDHTLPQTSLRITTHDLTTSGIVTALKHPWLILGGRARLLAHALEESWGIRGRLSDIAATPIWIINTTAYQSGKSWRIMRERMGGYKLEYTLAPQLPVSAAIAASAAYPGLVGPYILATNTFIWHRYKEWGSRELVPADATYKRIHLWDGGVYDNLGLEALFKPSGQGYRDGMDFLIVSDASRGLGCERPGLLHRRAIRLLNIAVDQVRSLRSRMVVGHFNANSSSGVYLRIGNTGSYIAASSGSPREELRPSAENCLSDATVRELAEYPTDLRKMARCQFVNLLRHGWETADITLAARCPELVSPIPFEEPDF